MERMTPGARRIGMTSQRHVRRGLLVAAGWGLLGTVLAGCGSVVASTGAPPASTPAGAAASTPAGTAAAGASASSASSAGAPLVGCASVNQATMVTIIRLSKLEVPVGDVSLTVTDRKPALVRAVFRDFCAAVTHPDVPPAVMRCPADFGTDYIGVFYAGNRVLARYIYDASGCRRVGIIVGSTTQSTVLAGPAASAAPHLTADFAAVLTTAKPGVTPTTSQNQQS